jgi:glycosyltransferase involved in cell wall biosynthesis
VNRSVVIIVENLSVPFDRRVWRECKALQDAGYKVSVISPKGIGTDRESFTRIDGIAIYRYAIPQANGSFPSYMLEYGVALLMSLWLMVRVLFREGYSVIQICNPPDLLIFAAIPFKLLGKKIIFDQHDLCPEIYRAQKGPGGGQFQNAVERALLFFEGITYRLSNVVLVVNESCRRIAVGRGRKVDSEVFIVRNGPSLHEIRSIEPNADLKRGKRYLLSYVGMMGAQDGVDLLLESVAKLVVARGQIDFHVRIMGGGTVLGDMKRYAERLGIADVITFTGHIPYPEVLEGIASADVCLCPDPKNALSDRCSLVKVTEYMSLGKPVVAFELDEVKYSAGGAAIYALSNDAIDFADKIHQLLEDENLCEAMGAIGRRRVVEFLTWEHSKEALYLAYGSAFQLIAHHRQQMSP